MTNNITYQHTLDKLNKFKRATDDMNGRRMFEDYMIMPVQRLLKYKLILESMSKTVPTDTMEHEALMMGLNVMHQVALRLNSEKSKLEARRKTKLFLNRLDSDWVNAASKRFYGVLGSCVLIGTLDIRILSESTKVKRLGCALFSSYMIIAKGKRHDRYEPRHWFPLRKFQVHDLPNEHPSLPHSWLLFSETQSIEFSAMCESEKQIWLDKLQGAIKTSKDEYEEQSQNSSTTAVEELFVSSISLSSTTATSSSSIINNNNNNNNDSNTMSAAGYPYDASSTTSLCSYLSRSESQQVQVNYSGSNITLDQHIINNTNTRPSTPRTIVSVNSTPDDLLSSNNNHVHGGSSSNNNNNVMSGDSPTHYTSSAQSSNVNSPGMRSQASISDFCDFVTNTVADFRSQRRHQQSSVRAIGIDNKFEDVCTTPILTARSQARNDRSSGIENSNQRKQQRRSRMGKSASMLAFTSIKTDEENNNSQQYHHYNQQQQQYHATSRSSVGPTPTTTISSPQDMFKSAVRRKASLPSRLRISEPIVNDIPVRRPPSTHSTHSAMISQNHQQLPPALNGSVRTDSMIFRLSRRGSLNNNNNNTMNNKKVDGSTTSLQSMNGTNSSTMSNKLQNVNNNNPAARLPPQATPGLPRSLSAATMGLARTSSRFFGRMVEKLGTIGTPRRTRRNATNARQQQNSFIPPSGGTSSVPPTMNSSDLSQQKPPKKSKRQLSKKPPPLIIPGSPLVRTNSITRKDRCTERPFQK
ncbi:hypothetical protein BDC45DRAFT_150686 [Circinella umbellata]|nr:hypothetical protein BDC45DRAFT_150686 [Circinella umbellata]